MHGTRIQLGYTPELPPISRDLTSVEPSPVTHLSHATLDHEPLGEWILQYV